MNANAAEAIYQQVIHFIPKAVVGMLIYLVFWVGSKLLEKVIQGMGRHTHLNKTIVNLIGQTAEVGVQIFGAITALGTLGVNVSAMLTGLGLTGFAVGLALKDVLSNVMAGIMILLYRPFRLGQRISITGFEGRVSDINLRYTTLDTDVSKVLIPNSNILTNSITILPEPSRAMEARAL